MSRLLLATGHRKTSTHRYSVHQGSSAAPRGLGKNATRITPASTVHSLLTCCPFNDSVPRLAGFSGPSAAALQISRHCAKQDVTALHIVSKKLVRSPMALPAHAPLPKPTDDPEFARIHFIRCITDLLHRSNWIPLTGSLHLDTTHWIATSSQLASTAYQWNPGCLLTTCHAPHLNSYHMATLCSHLATIPAPSTSFYLSPQLETHCSATSRLPLLRYEFLPQHVHRSIHLVSSPNLITSLQFSATPTHALARYPLLATTTHGLSRLLLIRLATLPQLVTWLHLDNSLQLWTYCLSRLSIPCHIPLPQYLARLDGTLPDHKAPCSPSFPLLAISAAVSLQDVNISL